ncbi:MAG: hypothetical protein M3Y87_18045 [Myxococcota bacterium]|nr:hypothetical protein [Myxococcota bacterium]
MRVAEPSWEREYEALAALLRGAPRVPWSAPTEPAARRAAAGELVLALEESARRAGDERARRLWSSALERARVLDGGAETSTAA